MRAILKHGRNNGPSEMGESEKEKEKEEEDFEI